MRRLWIASFLCLLLISSTHAAIDPPRIDSAVDRAREWLYKQQSDGRWEQNFAQHGDQSTGQTALVVYALLSAGESDQDPRIKSAIDYLKKTDTTGTYALGMRCLVWQRLAQTPDVKRALAHDAQVLRTSMITTGKGTGFYPYNSGAAAWSLSRAQYAVQGIWAAAQSGIDIPEDYWKSIETAWIESQDTDGGWAYTGKGGQYSVTPGITAVGVATLFITQDFLHSVDSTAPRTDPAITSLNRGMKWMITNFDKVATDTTFARDYPFATLYAVERIGVASGQKYLGTIDWYEKGMQWLLGKQLNDGSWPREDHGAVVNTSFAVMFLSRGRQPLVMNKLDYTAAGKKSTWNQRPRDVANISRWVGRQIEKDFNWQIVNLAAPVEDWHEAPILFLAGNEDIGFDTASRLKIKQFIEQGGLVLGNADTGSRNFATSFRRLGQELFPAYEFRELPAEHVIYTSEQFPRAKWKTKPSVLGLSNGVRELMLLIPQADVARTWQIQALAPREEYWQLASNIFLYSVDSKLLRKRGESYLVDRDSAVKADRKVQLARLKYAGNWDPEPGGWRRLSNILHNQEKIDLEPVTVDLAKDSLDGFKIAHLTGTDKFKLPDAARQKLRAFVNGGGTLIVDSAGGSSNFATAAEQELAAIIPDFALSNVPLDSPLLTTGSPLKKIGYRIHAAKILGELKDEPRLRAMEIQGKPGVIFSREDLSAGMVGNAVDGIVGYDPATAVEIMKRIVIYASK